MQDQIQGYFSEITSLETEEAFSLKIEKELYHESSPYQDILVFTSESFGNVLVLDGSIQCSDKDEFAYHEMIAHLPLFAHPRPKNVLIVGGGDGGAVREVAKHPEVETIHLCEIDEKVIEVSKQYLFSTNAGYESPKLKIHIEDAVKFMVEHKEEFDVIIVDCSDPVEVDKNHSNPATSLFNKDFYENIANALKPNGVLCGQCESFWYAPSLTKDCILSLKSIFPVVGYSSLNVPAYGGHYGLFLASKNEANSLRTPVHTLSEEQSDAWNLKYYSSEVHQASFILPPLAVKILHL